MDLKEIRQIIELMKRNDLSLFHLEREGFKIKLRKGVDFDAMVSKFGGMPSSQPALPHEAPAPVMAPVEAMAPPAGDGAATGALRVNSPMVGTFYRASGPGEKVFVNVGDTIEEGSTVCIIEAMKVMNEIKSEVRGVVTRILVEDATPVQYDTPLFEVKPA